MESRQLSLDDLECPVCRDVMESPIRTCVLSHNICDNCFTNVTVCPLCRAVINGDRNYDLENFGRSLVYQCTNKLEGCNFQAPLESIKTHNEFCQYTVTECPLGVLDNCRWSGKIQEIMNHCSSKHPNNTVSYAKQTLLCKNFLEIQNVNVLTLKRFHIVLKAHGELFKMIWGLNCSTGFTLWRVIYCGPKEDAVKYRFSVSFQNPFSLQDKLHLQGDCQPMSLQATPSPTMYIPMKQMRLVKYCLGMDLHYTVCILKISEEKTDVCNSTVYNFDIIEPEGRINRF